MKKFIRLCVIALYCSIFTSPLCMAATNPTHQESIPSSITQININTASAQELASKLNGVGLSKAERIVEYRDKYGPFVSVEQLKEVKGIGQSILDKNRALLVL